MNGGHLEADRQTHTLHIQLRGKRDSLSLLYILTGVIMTFSQSVQPPRLKHINPPVTHQSTVCQAKRYCEVEFQLLQQGHCVRVE